MRFWLLVIGVAGCSPDPIVDENATGIDLTVLRPEQQAIDQVEIVGAIEGAVVFGPVFAPEEPRELGLDESVVLLVDPKWSGKIVQLAVDGLVETVPVLFGQTSAVIAAKKVVSADVSLIPPAGCGDTICATDENNCTCVTDCPTPVCDDGCCSGDEDNATCPQDCVDDCGDTVCSTEENHCNCPDDCTRFCGDGCCSAPSEKTANCPEDCP